MLITDRDATDERRAALRRAGHRGEARVSARYAYLIAAVAAISGLLFGFDTAVINGALIFLRAGPAALDARHRARRPAACSSAAPSGAAFAGWLTDRLGRKRILIASALLFAVSSVGAARARARSPSSWPRASSAASRSASPRCWRPLYIAEISPRAIRGRLVSLNQMAIVSGILLAYFVNWALSRRPVELALDVRLGGGALGRLLRRPALRARVAALPRREGPRGRGPRGATRVGGDGAGPRSSSPRSATRSREESGTLRELFATRLRRPLGDRGLPRRLPADHRDQHGHLLRLAHLQGAGRRPERLGGDRRERDHRRGQLPR